MLFYYRLKIEENDTEKFLMEWEEYGEVEKGKFLEEEGEMMDG